MADLYQSIPAPFERALTGPHAKKLIRGRWQQYEFGLLADVPGWTVTEKIDGVTAVFDWDGYRVRVFTREGLPFTDEEQVDPATRGAVYAAVDEMACEQRLGAKTARIYCQVYGKGIGPEAHIVGAPSPLPPFALLPHQGFALIDAKIDGFWLQRSALEHFADDLGLPVSHLLPEMDTLTAAIEAVTSGPGDVVSTLTSSYGDFPVHGLVAAAPVGLLNRRGERILTKLMTADLHVPG